MYCPVIKLVCTDLLADEYMKVNIIFPDGLFAKNPTVVVRPNHLLICTYVGGMNHLFRRINFSILEHGMWFLKTCISVLLPEATLVLSFKIVSPVRTLTVNISIITLCIFLLLEFTLISILSCRYLIFYCYWTRFEKFCKILSLVWKNLVLSIEQTRKWRFERSYATKHLSMPFSVFFFNNELNNINMIFLIDWHWILFENYF